MAQQIKRYSLVTGVMVEHSIGPWCEWEEIAPYIKEDLRTSTNKPSAEILPCICQIVVPVLDEVTVLVRDDCPVHGKTSHVG